MYKTGKKISSKRTPATASKRFRVASLILLVALAASAGAQQVDIRQSRLQEIHRRLTNEPSHGFGALTGRCFSWNEISYTVGDFEDTLENNQQLMTLLEALPALEEPLVESYQISSTNGRWTRTATDGPPPMPPNQSLPIRTPITLTYSFVPDGTTVPSQHDEEPTDGSTLFAAMNANFPGGESAWKAKFGAALNRIGTMTGITYMEVSDDGASFPGSAGQLGVRGDIRIAMHSIDGSDGPNVLAYNFFPNTGDMVLDVDNMSFWTNSTNDYRNLRQVVMHEHGHGLGYKHVDPINGTKLMEAFYSSNFDGPQEDDIRGFQRQYLDGLETNDSVFDAYGLGVLPATAGDLSIEDDGLVDVYSFAAPVSGRIHVTVSPVGTTYDVGPQEGIIVAVDALRIHDLAFDLLDEDGTTVLATVDDNGLGEAESLTDFQLPPGMSTGYLRVQAILPTDDIQRYSISLSEVTEPDIDVSPLLLDFGEHEISDGPTASQTVSIQNLGNGELSFIGDGIAIVDSSEFFISNMAPLASIPSSGEINVEVGFDPEGTNGPREGTLRITTNDPDESTVEVSLGAGAVPVELSWIVLE